MLNSPYVRRVAVALMVAKVPFEHRPISLFRHIDAFSAINPLLKAPTFVADDGTVLIEFDLILDYFAGLYPAVAALTPRPGDRARALRLTGLALAAMEKAVQRHYERALRPAGKAAISRGSTASWASSTRGSGRSIASCRKPAGSPAASALPTSRRPAPTASP